MSQDPERGWQGPDENARLGPAAFDSQLGDLVAYCRALTGRDDDAVSTAREVLDSARSLLTDPRRLRAWLFALARLEITAGSGPEPREIFDLVHRHGMRPEDLPVVLGISPADADEMLAAADVDPGWDEGPGRGDYADLEGQQDLPGIGSRGDMFEALLPGLVAYCRDRTGREEGAISIAHGVVDNARSLLTDPDRLRAWLFATARRERVGDAAPTAMEILDLVHRHRISAAELPAVLGIPAMESDELLAAAEEAYAGSAFGSGPHGVNSADGRAGAGGADWDEVFDPSSHRWYDTRGPFRTSPELAGRHAAPVSSGRLRQALARGPVRVAAATGIVVAVIGVSTAYLASFNSPPPSQAGQQARHHPVAAPSPATTHGPAPTPTPASTSPQPVTVVLPPQPAPASTSPRSSPRPSPKPSPKPTSSSPKPSPSPSGSPSPSPSPTPS